MCNMKIMNHINTFRANTLKFSARSMKVAIKTTADASGPPICEGFRNRSYSVRWVLAVFYLGFPPFKCSFPSHSLNSFSDPVYCHFASLVSCYNFQSFFLCLNR
jgi:hypothetical protein